jgi:uncharacterized protein with GYD domain
MNTYIMLMKFTEAGAASIKDARWGRSAGKKMASAFGIRWKASYLVMGSIDIVLIVEAPDDETMARFTLAGLLTGSFSSETMRAFTEKESDEIIKSLPEMPPA